MARARKRPASNLEAVDQTIRALEQTGRVENIDAALVQAARKLAEAVDVLPDNAALWRQYMAALNELRALDDGGDDDLDRLTRMLAEVGDASQP